MQRLQAAEKEAVARREEAQVAAAAAGGDAMDAEYARFLAELLGQVLLPPSPPRRCVYPPP